MSEITASLLCNANCTQEEKRNRTYNDSLRHSLIWVIQGSQVTLLAYNCVCVQRKYSVFSAPPSGSQQGWNRTINPHMLSFDVTFWLPGVPPSCFTARHMAKYVTVTQIINTKKHIGCCRLCIILSKIDYHSSDFKIHAFSTAGSFVQRPVLRKGPSVQWWGTSLKESKYYYNFYPLLSSVGSF